jgi:ribosomal protein L14
MFIEAKLNVRDNSGIFTTKFIKNIGGSFKKKLNLGDTLITVVQKHRKNRKYNPIQKCALLSRKCNILRSDGSSIRFDKSSVATLSSKQRNKLLGKKIFVPVAKELRKKKILKLGVITRFLL